jgi:hypothetical protein
VSARFCWNARANPPNQTPLLYRLQQSGHGLDLSFVPICSSHVACASLTMCIVLYLQHSPLALPVQLFRVKTNSNVAPVPKSLRNNISLNCRIATVLRFLRFHSSILSIAGVEMDGHRDISTAKPQ